MLPRAPKRPPRPSKFTPRKLQELALRAPRSLKEASKKGSAEWRKPLNPAAAGGRYDRRQPAVSDPARTYCLRVGLCGASGGHAIPPTRWSELNPGS